jgi:hypothetical protein
MSKRIIWLSGWASSGKDTAAEAIVALGGVRFAFADSLKDIVSEKYEFPRHWCDTVEGKATVLAENSKSVRELLIYESREAKKENINVFARIVLEKIVVELTRSKLVVISDWRFPHEYDFITKNMVDTEHITIRIVRNGLVPLADSSEHELDTWISTYKVVNHGISDFQAEIQKIVMQK